jgi:hypothetical protein
VPLTGRKLGVLAVVVIALLGGSALASGKVRPLTKAQMRACLGMSRPLDHVAKVAPANPSVLGAFRAFAATPAKPVKLTGMSALGNSGVATYDPAHAVDLANPSAGWRLVLLPVDMAAAQASPKYCERIPDWREAQRLSAGESGSGVCVLAVVSGGDLQGSLCESLRRLSSYLGALNLVEYGFDPRAVTLAPDGVSAVRYSFRHGKATTVEVHHNLWATPVFALPGYGPGIPERYKLRVFRRWFPRTYPSKIALLRPDRTPVVEWRRPTKLFDELAAVNRLQLDIWNLTPSSQRPN